MERFWKTSRPGSFGRLHRAVAAAVAAAVALAGPLSGLSYASPAGGVDAMLTRARALKRQGRAGEALALYEKAVKTAPGSSDAHDRLGFMYFELGRFDEALAQMKEAIRLNPKNANAHHHLGSLYLRLNRIPEAADQFRTAMALDPSKSCNCGPIERLVLTTPPAEGIMTPEEADRVLSGLPKKPPATAARRAGTPRKSPGASGKVRKAG